MLISLAASDKKREELNIPKKKCMKEYKTYDDNDTMMVHTHIKKNPIFPKAI